MTFQQKLIIIQDKKQYQQRFDNIINQDSATTNISTRIHKKKKTKNKMKHERIVALATINEKKLPDEG